MRVQKIGASGSKPVSTGITEFSGDASAALHGLGALCKLSGELKRRSVMYLPFLPRGSGPVPSLFSRFLGIKDLETI